MIELRKKNVFSVKKIWCSLFANNSDIAPFMDYEHHICWRTTAIVNNNIDKLNNLPHNKTYYVAYDNNEPVCVIPLCGDRRNRKIMAYSDGIAYLDFIYPDSLTVGQMAEILKALEKTEKGTVRLEYLHPNSRLLPALELLGIPYDVQEECVHIDLKGNHDEYLKSLSKGSRHNLNTAYHRLENDGRAHRCEIYWRKGIPGEYKNQLSMVSAKRMHEIQGDEDYRTALRYAKIRYINPTLKYLSRSENAVLSVFYIDEKIAGFMYGVIQDKCKTIVVPKLAYNSEFARYAPGKLLLNETIKYLHENTDIRVLDLANGDEDYKFYMGGISHNIYKADLVCE